jgi:SAM-dependent methyltransferase
MIGFTFQKPHGYAGDFELIDRIYSQRKSNNKSLHRWDSFYHDLEAATAVRNRKQYFKNLVDLTENKQANPLVLNLGSGPCSDLYEYLQKSPKQSVRFECLDMDETAIEFGSVVCDNYIDDIKFIHKNAFRFKPSYQYELIWSAGLFDYFNDKLFVRLLNRMYGLVKSGGEIVIGNFSNNNPSKAVMEVFGQWFLYHRSEEKLVQLAMMAGIPRDLINVSQEEAGVNLFLHVRKNNN